MRYDPEMRIVVALLVLCGCALRPGETRCTTTNVYGTAVTNCKTGEAEPAPVAATPKVSLGYWCARDLVDKVGICFYGSPGNCEAWKTKVSGYGACGFQQVAICAGETCFVDSGSCGQVERENRRDGSACVVR